MNRILMLVAVTAMIGGNLLAAQVSQENGVRYRIGDTLRANADPAAPARTNHNSLRFVRPSGVEGNQAAPRRTTFQNSSPLTQRRVYQTPQTPSYHAPTYQTRQSYQQFPRPTVPRYPVRPPTRNYIPPIPKDVIPLRETPVRPQVVETQESKELQNHQFAPRKARDSYSLELDEYSQRVARPPIVQQNAENGSGRIIQLRSKSAEPIDQQTVRNSEQAPLVEKPIVKSPKLLAPESQIQVVEAENQRPQPKMQSKPVELLQPKVVETSPFKKPTSFAAVTKPPLSPKSQIKVVEAENQWPQPKMQSKPVELLQPKVVETTPFKKPKSFAAVTKPPLSPKSQIEVVEAGNQWVGPKMQSKPVEIPRLRAVETNPLKKPLSYAAVAKPVEAENQWVEPKTQSKPVELPRLKAVETMPFKKPPSFAATKPSLKPSPKPSKVKVTQDRVSKPFHGPFEKPSGPALPTQQVKQLKTQIEKRVVGNEFSPRPFVKKESNNSFLPPIPKKKFADLTPSQFGLTQTQPIFLESQSELPVQTFEAPKLPTRVAAASGQQTPEAAGWSWWLYLLPFIPLLLIGWFLLRGLFVGEQEYHEPITSAEPRGREYLADRANARSMETNLPPTAGAKLNAADTAKPVAVVKKETASAQLEATVSDDIQILSEEDIELFDETSLDATEGCCSANEQTSNCCSVSESKELRSTSKVEPKPEAKPAIKQSRQESKTVGLKRVEKKRVEKTVAEKTVAEKTSSQTSEQKKARDFASSFAENRKKSKLSTPATNLEQASKKVSAPAKGASAKNKFDDLTRIRGIDSDVASQLRDSGIDSYSKLSKAGPERISQILMSGGTKFQFINPTQWPAQAELAAEGDWKGLRRWQTYHKELPGTKVEQQSAVSAAGATGKTAEFDLTKIRGISPEVARILRDSGINSYSKLAKSSPKKLKQILKSGGSKFQFINPTQWPEQAALASKGDWNGLIAWQEKFKELPSLKSTETSSEKKSARQATKNKPNKSTASVAKYSASDKDDLTKIDGIGAATQRFLNKNEIFSFAQIASMDNGQLKAIFANRGNRFQLLNTQTWAAQAKQAMESTSEESQSGKKVQSNSKPSATNILSLDTTGTYSTDQQVSS